MTPRQNWLETNPWKARLIVTALCLVALEIITRVAVNLDLLPYHQYPATEFPVYYDVLDPVIGRWRYPNAEIKCHESCFEFTWQSNSFGAHDVERSLTGNGKPRVILLGDSFTDGYGVATEKRFSNLAEHDTGIEHLNFALTGTGTIEQSLTYKTKAKAFAHDEVYIFILPFNDFKDIDPSPDDIDYKPAYRPLLRDTGNGLEVYYPMRFEDRPRSRLPLFRRLKSRFDNASYLANVLRWGMRIFKFAILTPRGTHREPVETPSYEDYTASDWKKMAFALQSIVDEADNRPVRIFTIPFFKDFEVARNGAYHFKLVDDLQRFAANHPTVRYTDLLPYFLKHAQQYSHEYGDYVLPCDLHWNELGHRVTADAIADAVAKDKATTLQTENTAVESPQ